MLTQTAELQTVHLVVGQDSELAGLNEILSGDGYVVDISHDTCALFNDPPEALSVTIVEFGLGNFNDAELIQSLLVARPAASVLVAMRTSNHRDTVACMKAGATDVLISPIERADLLNAVKEAVVYAGESLIAPVARVELRRKVEAAITPRQLEVLRLIASGQRNKDVARAKGISIRTVEAHRSRMMDRLGAKSIADLVRLAVRAGLCE